MFTQKHTSQVNQLANTMVHICSCAQSHTTLTADSICAHAQTCRAVVGSEAAARDRHIACRAVWPRSIAQGACAPLAGFGIRPGARPPAPTC